MSKGQIIPIHILSLFSRPKPSLRTKFIGLRSKDRSIPMHRPAMNTDFRLFISNITRETYAFREESSSNRSTSRRNVTRKNITDSTVHSQSFLDTSTEIRHLHALRERNRIRDFTFPCKSIDLIHEFLVHFRIGDDVVENCAKRDSGGI